MTRANHPSSYILIDWDAGERARVSTDEWKANAIIVMKKLLAVKVVIRVKEALTSNDALDFHQFRRVLQQLVYIWTLRHRKPSQSTMTGPSFTRCGPVRRCSEPSLLQSPVLHADASVVIRSKQIIYLYGYDDI